jgi:tetratricopeptide (TPR) repeat protein
MRQITGGALAALVVLAGCSARSAELTPIISATGIVYEVGTPPTPTRASQTATLYLRQDRHDRALELVLEGIADDPGNPIHYFLAGIAHARLGAYEDAHAMFSEAERIYPAYELLTELEREAAWGQAFNDGLDAYNAGEVSQAIDSWSAATALFDQRPEAHRNLARLLTDELRFTEAIAVLRAALEGLEKLPASRVLPPEEEDARVEDRFRLLEGLGGLLLATERFAEAEPVLRERLERDPSDPDVRADLAASLAGQGRSAEASSMYATILEEGGLTGDQLYNIGVALFRSTNYQEAAQAFRELTLRWPESRDAWFNYANALFAAEDWGSLSAVGLRLVELDPLGENSRLITARAQLESGDREGALQTLDGADQAPIYLDRLQLRRSGGITTIAGRVSGNLAEADSLVRLRFSFYDDAGVLVGAETFTLSAPGPGATRELEVEFPRPASGYRYELISS